MSNATYAYSWTEECTRCGGSDGVAVGQGDPQRGLCMRCRGVVLGIDLGPGSEEVVIVREPVRGGNDDIPIRVRRKKGS